MWVIFIGLLQFLVGLIVLLLVILVLPFHYRGYVSYIEDHLSWEIDLRWAWFISLNRFLKAYISRTETEEDNSEALGIVDTAEASSEAKRSNQNDSNSTPVGSGQFPVLLDEDTEGKLESEVLEGSQQEKVEMSSSINDEHNDPVIVDIQTKVVAEPELSVEHDGRQNKVEGSQAVIDFSKDEVSGDAHGSAKSTEPLGKSKMGTRQIVDILLLNKSWLWSWCRRLWRLLHFSPLYLRGTLGLGDPYTTNEFFRYFYPSTAFLVPIIQVDIIPDYASAEVDLTLSLQGWLSPLHVLYALFCLLFDKTTHRLWKLLKP